MEVVQFVPQLGQALWTLKGVYDQHVENGNEIKELQSFIEDFARQNLAVGALFKECGGNAIAIAAFANLEADVKEATRKLQKWSTNKSFFRVFNSTMRMQKLGKLHSKVMASMQKNLGIANLSMLVDLRASQATILKSNAELKSLLIQSIGGMPNSNLAEVRDELVEARSSSFVDQEFWEDIVAAVNVPPLPNSSVDLVRPLPLPSSSVDHVKHLHKEDMVAVANNPLSPLPSSAVDRIRPLPSLPNSSVDIARIHKPSYRNKPLPPLPSSSYDLKDKPLPPLPSSSNDLRDKPLPPLPSSCPAHQQIL